MKESNICQRCDQEDEDLRAIYMQCNYDMGELNIPFEIESIYEEHESREIKRMFYILKVCKSCRSDWMHFIKLWFNSFPPHLMPSCKSGIFIRDLGANREIPEEHYNLYHKNKNEK